MTRFRLIAAVLLLIGLLAPPAVARHHETRDPFPEEIALPDGFAPEGITTGRGTTVYVGSLVSAGIWRGDVRTGDGTVIGGEGNTAVGLDYDARRNLVWVAGGPTGEVNVYDASTGALLETYAFDAGFLNDVVVTRDAVYVTDSFVQQLAVIPLPDDGTLPAPDSAFTLELTGDIAYVAGEFNANGVVARAGYLVVVQSNTGQLFRVDPESGNAVEIDLSGDGVTAGDGLELVGSTLYVVRNELEEVAVIRLTGNLTRGDVVATLTEDDLDVPTTATLAAGRLWAVNARFGTTPTAGTEYWITQLSRHPHR